MKDYTFPLQVGLVNYAIDEIKARQRDLIKVDNRNSRLDLNNAYKAVFTLVGDVNRLRGLRLLDDGTYRILVEENVRIEEKIRLLIKEKPNGAATHVRRTENYSRS